MAEQDSKVKMAKYTAEFVGTFMLVLSVGCNVQTGNATWGVTSIACTLMVMIYCFGGISGGHLNPAVSLTMILTKKEEPRDMGIYMGIQIAGGIAAACTYSMMFGAFNLAPVTSWWQAALAEILYTFMLCFVVLNVACSKQHAGKNQFYALAIGFVVVAGGYAAGHHSGGCFNPAVALGLDVSSILKGFGWGPAYTLFEFVGAALAAALYKVVRPDDIDKDTPAVEPCKYPLNNRLVSEAVGTYMLVLTVGLNVLGSSPAPVWSIAASLMCMIFALGTCSGAHFNPAVTVAIAASRRDKIPNQEVGAYICAQLAGGLAGALTYTAMEKGNSFPLAPGKGYGWIEAWGYEMVFTFLLAFTVLCVATTKDAAAYSNVFGLCIGSCVTVGGYAIGAISGGSLNPAVSLGIALTGLMNGGGIFHCIFYMIFECLGGVLAAVLFKVTHPAEYDGEWEVLPK